MRDPNDNDWELSYLMVGGGGIWFATSSAVPRDGGPRGDGPGEKSEPRDGDGSREAVTAARGGERRLTVDGVPGCDLGLSEPDGLSVEAWRISGGVGMMCSRE